MCHTDFMKKSLLLFVPFVISLAACGRIRFDYEEGDHSAGLDSEVSSSQQNNTSYQYFYGDHINETDLNVAHLTFDVTNSASNMAKEDINALINCDDPDLFVETSNASWVGIKKDTALFIGVNSTSLDGILTLSFSSDIQYVSIKACPYYTSEIVGFENRTEHDENVAIAINSSKYYRLTYSYNPDSETVGLEDCCFQIRDNRKNEITIKAGPGRALIDEITLYY